MGLSDFPILQDGVRRDDAQACATARGGCCCGLSCRRFVPANSYSSCLLGLGSRSPSIGITDQGRPTENQTRRQPMALRQFGRADSVFAGTNEEGCRGCNCLRLPSYRGLAYVLSTSDGLPRSPAGQPGSRRWPRAPPRRRIPVGGDFLRRRRFGRFGAFPRIVNDLGRRCASP